MTREQVIEHLCTTVSLAFNSIGDFHDASDGFCAKCSMKPGNFQHSGRTLRYVRDAVVAKLKADGYGISEGFDPVTGNSVQEETLV